MPFLSPNQQCQNTEGKKYHIPYTCSPHARLGSSVYAGCIHWRPQASMAPDRTVRRRRRTVRRWRAYASSCKLSINLVCIIYALRENGDGLLDSRCGFQWIFRSCCRYGYWNGEEEEKKTADMDETVDTAAASGWYLQRTDNGFVCHWWNIIQKLHADGRWCCGRVILQNRGQLDQAGYSYAQTNNYSQRAQMCIVLRSGNR